MKKVLINLFKYFGYEVIPTWKKESLAMTETINKLFKDNKINCVLDVGGNKGQYRDFLRNQVGYEGMIITFEPTEKNFNICSQRAVGDENWQVVKYALGDNDEQREIKIMMSDAFSSFLEPSIKNVSDFASKNVVESTEIVNIRKLDSIWEDLNINGHNIYLKMDTQGYDPNVMNGVKKNIDKVCALQTEASVIGIYEGMYSLSDHIRFMNDFNFDICGMYPVTFDKKGRVVEFDVIMINSKL